MPATKTHPACMHHPQRLNVTTSVTGLKMVTYTQLSPKMVNPRDIAGNAEEEDCVYVESDKHLSVVIC